MKTVTRRLDNHDATTNVMTMSLDQESIMLNVEAPTILLPGTDIFRGISDYRSEFLCPRHNLKIKLAIWFPSSSNKVAD